MRAQSVASGVAARACSAAIAAWSAYGPGGRRSTSSRPSAICSPVPLPAILLVEEHELPARTGAGVAPRVLEEHEREQAGDLRLVRHQRAEDACQPDRLGAELPPHERLARGRRVALVEDEIQRGEHGAEPVRQLVVGRHDVRDARVADLPLGAHQPLLHRRLRREEGVRDLRRAQAAEGSERERDPRLGRERRMTAGEDQAQPVVRDGAVVHLVHLVLLVRRRERLELLHLVLEPASPAEAVDRLVPRGGRDPRGRVARQATARPDLEGDEEGVLHRLLGEVEVAEHADERRDRPSRLVSEQAVDGLVRNAYRRASAACVCSADPRAS